MTGRLPAVQRAAESAGVPLSAGVRDELEPRLDTDLGDVRVHTGAASAEAADALDAQAYTTGKDIHFGAGRYQPDDPFGLHLIAHEVAHTVQQGDGDGDGSGSGSGDVGDVQLRGETFDVSAPGDPHEVEAERFADAVSAGSAASMISPISRRSISRRTIQREDKAAPAPGAPADPAAPDGVLSAKLRASLIKGDYNAAGKATYTEAEVKKGAETVKVFQKFDNADLQAALEYCLKTWAPSVKAATPAPGGGGGDSSAKAVDSHPAWVEQFQIKLAVQQPLTNGAQKKAAKPNPKGEPQWSEDSEVVQAVLSAFLHEWTRRISGGKEATANMSELYGRVGDSETNERARLIGGEPNGPNWCGPASEVSAALGLMRRGLRFQGQKKQLANVTALGKDPGSGPMKASYDKQLRYVHARALQSELIQQGAAFLTSWLLRKDRQGKGRQKSGTGERFNRGVYGQEAQTTPLQAGDEIYLAAKASPLSGHVATVIREERILPDPIDRKVTPAGTIISKVYCVSGNAGAHGGGAVRVEQVKRELPPENYSYYMVAEWGNQHDRLRDAASNERTKAKQAYAPQMKPLFLADVKADPENQFVRTRKELQAKGKKIPYPVEADIENYFNAYWNNLGAMLAVLRSNAAAYQALHAKYQAEYGTKVDKLEGDFAHYKRMMVSRGIPYNKSGNYDKFNTDGRFADNKVDALKQMQEYFRKNMDKTKFKDFKPPFALGENAATKKWGYALGQYNTLNNKYDKAWMTAHLMPGTIDGYMALITQFDKEKKDPPAAAAAPAAGAAPAAAAPAAADAKPVAADAKPAAADAKPAAADAKPVTGNISPTIDGHIWVTSIMRAGNVDPAKIEAEIKEAQQAAAKGHESQLDPAAAAPGVDLAAIRAEVIDSWGLQDLGGTIDENWPGALAYWEGLGTF